ncbi:MAG: hypothetical protein R2693_06985 [Nocardioidaceae bacterium]
MARTDKKAASITDAGIGARSIPEFDGVHDVWPRGERLRAVRAAAAAYKTRFQDTRTGTGGEVGRHRRCAVPGELRLP